MLPRTFCRKLTSIANERMNFLREVYAPFRDIENGTPEYMELARSGKVWEDFHRPQDSDKMGYTRLNRECQDTLLEIDKIRKVMKRPPSLIAKELVAEYAHQSVRIENNHLGLGDSHKIYDFLAATTFRDIDMASTSLRNLTQVNFPSPAHLFPKADQNEVLELRNHIVISQWIAETALHSSGTSGLDEEDVRLLSTLTMKDLGRDGLYPWSFGPRVPLGNYRETPIGVRSNPLRIFPYHIEVPACMQRFFQWKENEHEKQQLHSLILACQITAYFLHIHPFLDGNGRVSRMIMHDYMVRQGYLPVIFQPMEREDYLSMISDAQDGKPDEFVCRVVTTQLEALFSLSLDGC